MIGGTTAVLASTTIVATFALDALFGEPPTRIHPVALFGRLVAPFDRAWRRPRAVGLVVAIALPLAVAIPLGLLTHLAWTVDPIFAGLIATTTLFSTTSLRSLLAAATSVIDATEDGDLAAARTASLALVGRETDDLTAAQLRSAAVESVAENLADGLVAPLLAFTLGALVSLPVAVAAAVFLKAVNTLDSMLGYRTKPVGWASARLDDAVMWVPARITAVLLSIAALDPTALGRARGWAGRPASPNSGWPMATMAAVLDVRLEKSGAYVLHPTADLPTVDEARRSVRIVGIAGLLSFVLAGGITVAFGEVLAWS